MRTTPFSSALLGLSACSTLTGVEAGPILDVARHPDLDGAALDVHLMGKVTRDDGPGLWLDEGVQGKVTSRAQQLGVELGLGASSPVGSIVTYARGDGRLSGERFDEKGFFTPGVFLEIGLGIPFADWLEVPVLSDGLCGGQRRTRHRTLLTLAPNLDYSAHFTRDGEAFAGLSLGVARLDKDEGLVPGCHTIGEN